MQHLEEGTIHAWLDGELSAEEAAAAEAHVRECAQCSAALAEARGLIAASTRILTALDDVPSRVIPAPARKRHWYDRTDIRAAAAVLLVAGTSLVVLRSRNAGVSMKAVAVDTAVAAPLAAQSDANAAAPAAKEAPQEKFSVTASGVAAADEDDAANRVNAKKMSVPSQHAENTTADNELEKATRARDQINRAIAQAPAPQREQSLSAPPAVSADSVSGSRLGALMDFSRAKTAVSGRGRVEGRITDQRQGSGLEGANVMVQGTTLSAGTDKEGKFKIDNVPAGEQRLIVRRVGYAPQTIPLSMKDTAITKNVALAPDATALSEVVVTGANAVKGAGELVVKQLRTDSTGGVRRTVYEYSGVEVTLAELPEPQISARRDEKAVAAAPAPPPPAPSAEARQTINTITWSDRGRRYTLSGPLSTNELTALKARLMAMRR